VITPMSARRWLVAAIPLFACGSRTGLLSAEDFETLTDAGPSDGGLRHDGSIFDAAEEPLPLIDATPRPDVNRNDCPDAAATLIYVVASSNELYSFYPPDGTFKRIGLLACPGPGTPFSMAVDRKGVAYVVFQNDRQNRDGTTTPLPGDGDLFRVSTATAACIGTPYQAGQQGIYTFGMTFASNTNGPEETLFIAPDNGATTTSFASLATIDLTTFSVGVVGTIAPRVQLAELTGTGDGRLFAFYRTAQNPTASAIGELDKTTARIIAETPLPTVDQGNHWAFGFWGGDFYTFTGAQGQGTTVTRVRPSDGSVTAVASLNTDITGAGVSTCAPEQ
jgi:hypothetical protein